jgi:hypothetical protein
MSNKNYVIKKHQSNPFDIAVHADILERNVNLEGYLCDVDIYTCQYTVVKSPILASRYNIADASLLVAKLNKLNMRFYEIDQIQNIP